MRGQPRQHLVDRGLAAEEDIGLVAAERAQAGEGLLGHDQTNRCWRSVRAPASTPSHPSSEIKPGSPTVGLGFAAGGTSSRASRRGGAARSFLSLLKRSIWPLTHAGLAAP